MEFRRAIERPALFNALLIAFARSQSSGLMSGRYQWASSIPFVRVRVVDRRGFIALRRFARLQMGPNCVRLRALRTRSSARHFAAIQHSPLEIVDFIGGMSVGSMLNMHRVRVARSHQRQSPHSRAFSFSAGDPFRHLANQHFAQLHYEPAHCD